MSNNDRETLSDVFVGIMEKFAFMFGEHIPGDELPEVCDECYRVEMSFAGPRGGALIMIVPVETASEIAANFLGMDEDDEFVTSRAIDALKEVLNVTCGHILTAVAGDKPVFDLSPPDVATVARSAWENLLADESSMAFNVDESPMLLKFTFEGAP